jgi:hypothetical protein
MNKKTIQINLRIHHLNLPTRLDIFQGDITPLAHSAEYSALHFEKIGWSVEFLRVRED